MTAPATTPPTFSGEELTQSLSLIKDSDSVELKLTVPESDQRSTVTALGMDPLEAQIRQVFFFEPPDLKLDNAGVVVRARRIRGKGERLGREAAADRAGGHAGRPAEIRRLLRRGRCATGRVRLLGTMKGILGPNDIQRAAVGNLSLRKAFSKEQPAVFAAHAPEGIALDDLTILLLKLRFAPKELKRRLVAEMWVYLDRSRVLELSSRCTTDEAFQAAAELRAYLAGRGVDVSGEHETKTREALEYFAKALGKAGA